MENTHNYPKEKLNECVIGEFKGFITPGLHVCDLTTGGGKSHAISQLSTSYYLDHFDRVVILCVQNKLVDGMLKEIKDALNEKGCKITLDDLLVVRSNTEVARNAIVSRSFDSLLEEMDHAVSRMQKENARDKTAFEGQANRIILLQKSIEKLRIKCHTLQLLLPKSDTVNDYEAKEFETVEEEIRKLFRNFFSLFFRVTKEPGNQHCRKDRVHKLFPSLVKVYPQVMIRKKKIVLMTVQKGVYGIDPILSEKLTLEGISGNEGRTLFFFDESDLAAVSIRDSIIAQAIGPMEYGSRSSGIYSSYLHYFSLLGKKDMLYREYISNDLLQKNLDKAIAINEHNLLNSFGIRHPYNDIQLSDENSLDEYRRGIFTVGPAFRISIAPKKGKHLEFSYICYNRGTSHLVLLHCSGEKLETLRKKYDHVISMDSFISMLSRNLNMIKSLLCKVGIESYKVMNYNFEKEIELVSSNADGGESNYYDYPTLDKAFYSLMTRFDGEEEWQMSRQLMEHVTNRKNIVVHDGKEEIKIPDNSVYSQGIQFFEEDIDSFDYHHKVRILSREISSTPEKLVLSLLEQPANSVVFCSATSSSRSLVSNFALYHLSNRLEERMSFTSLQTHQTFEKYLYEMYPKEYRIDVHCLDRYEVTSKEISLHRMPERFIGFFSEEAIKEGLPQKWFKATCKLMENRDEGINKINLTFYRLFQFIEAYRWFIDTADVRSMIYFQNRSGSDPEERAQFMCLSCLIDGSYRSMSEFEGEIPVDWNNPHIVISRSKEEVDELMLKKFSSDKDAKMVLITAYNSFKAGENLQYDVPEGLDILKGDDWNNEAGRIKKDWDAVYLQLPTNYLTLNKEDNLSKEQSLYKIMLTLMMLWDNAKLSKADVENYLGQALREQFFFSDKNNADVLLDKAAWVLTMTEQAVGRLCRTKNKMPVTHILYDQSMLPYFRYVNRSKSYTKEFRALFEDALQKLSSFPIDEKDQSLCHSANKAHMMINRMLRIALTYSIHSNECDDDEMDNMDENDSEKSSVSYNVDIHQRMIRRFKKTILRKPVIGSLQDLGKEERVPLEILDCYGAWPRSVDGGYVCHRDADGQVCADSKTGQLSKFEISPSSVRLDVMMRNEVIRKWFEDHGYATDWNNDGLILHPDFLIYYYAGEIGEEAFAALVSHYAPNVKLEQLMGKDYELADFVIKDAETGENLIAFDVKNMNPLQDHSDRPGDLPSAMKISEKESRLGCKVIIVNIVGLDAPTRNASKEICGLIDSDGRVIMKNMDTLLKLLSSKTK
jgi:hypothetical protein